MTIEAFKNEILSQNPGWKISFEQCDLNEIHLVFSRGYSEKLHKLFIEKSNTNIECWIGFHQHNKSQKSKILITVDSVAIVNNDPKNNYTGKKIYRKRFNHPKNIELSNIYHIDPEDLMLFFKAKKMSYKDFLEIIYKKHISQTIGLKGIVYRIKERFRFYIISPVFSLINYFLQIIMFLMNGRKYKSKMVDITFDEFVHKAKIKNQLEIDKEEKKIEIFSIKVNAISAITYSILHLLLLLIYIRFQLSNIFISKINSSTILNVAYVIVTLTLWERTIPYLLHKAILYTAKISSELKEET